MMSSTPEELLQKYERQLKSIPVQFTSIALGVKQRLDKCTKKRRSSRLFTFDQIRDIPNCKSPIVPKTDETQEQRLKKWKEDKEKKKMEASAQKKKPFVVGLSRNPLQFVPPPPLKPMPCRSGRVTRSQTAQNEKAKVSEADSKSFAPKNAKFNPKLNNIVKFPLEFNSSNQKLVPVPIPGRSGSTIEIKVVQNEVNTNNNLTESSSGDSTMSRVQNRRSTRRNVKKNKVNNKMMVSESSSSADSTSSLQEHIVKAVLNLPNPRTEMKKKIDEGLLDDHDCEMEILDHLKQQLDSEIKRLTEMCNIWDKILNEFVLPEPVQEAVLCAVGQARLLMSQKMQQFATLLARAEQPEHGTAQVKPMDVQGFWDMVSMQVRNINLRFKTLEEMRARDWEDELPPARVAALPAARPPSRPKRPQAPRAAASRLKDLIAAKRKEKKDQDQGQQEKNFEAGFSNVNSSICSHPSSVTLRRSLRLAMRSNEAQRASVSKDEKRLETPLPEAVKSPGQTRRKKRKDDDVM